MKQLIKLSLALFLTSWLISCNSAAKDKNGPVNEKKKALQEKRDQVSALSAEITKLENDIAVLDPASVKKEKPKLVAVSTVKKQNFVHFIDLQGTLDAENISYVAPRGQGGLVKSILVKKGDNVRKGQLLLRLDNAIVQQNIETAKTQLAYAKDLYQRQKNLWDQKIGTEVQLITAANNVQQIERNISTLEEQLSFSNVYAEVSGVADEVNIRVGEFFQGANAQGQPQIRIVNSQNLKAVTTIPENYLNRVKKGTPVLIEIPDMNKTFKSTISYIGQAIGLTSRGFTAESKLPSSAGLKPNQIALIKIQDYTAPNAISIPINTLQTDENGKYVLMAVNDNGRQVAKKKQITVGELYGDNIEIKSGIVDGDVLITEGFQGLYEGQLINTANP